MYRMILSSMNELIKVNKNEKWIEWYYPVWMNDWMRNVLPAKD